MPAPVLQFKRGNAGVAGTVPALRPGEPAISLNNFDFFIGIDTSVANNKFFGSHRYWGREDGTNSLNLKLVDKDGTNYVAIKAPNTLGGNVTYVLPGTQGATSSVLTNDGSGNLTWASGSANPVFSGIATFSDTTDNTLGDVNTGAVQIDGGVGIAKNVTVGAGLSVIGESYFIGTATFYGGQINLGDSDGDNISVAGEFVSNLVPNATNTYDLGLTGKRWRDGYFSRNLDVIGNLNVDGNVTIGGTAVTLLGEDVFIKNKDIVLGYTTSVTNTDASTDDTANHAGVAIASTIGTPLTSFSASGINTLPDTYKQLMWFKQGTLGFGTDAFAFNYGVAIGTTNMANGVRLAVGTGVTIGDTTVTAANFYGALTGNVTGNASSADQVKTVTASNNNANYYVTFVDANNGSATNESVYTDDGIYYNPGTNKLTTQHAEFTGDVLVSGITTLTGNVTVNGTITGTATTATRATLVDTTGTSTNADYYVTFVDTLAGQTSETLRVGAGLSVNPSNGDVKTTGTLSVGNPGALTSYIKAGGGSNALYLYSNGDVSFQAKAVVNEIRSSSNASTLITLSDLDATFARNVVISGIATVGTSLSTPSIHTQYIKGSSGLTTAITISAPDITVAGDITVGGNGLKASDGNTNITLSSNTLTTFSGDIRVNGNDIQASDGTVALTLAATTGNVTTAGDLIVGGNDIKASDGTTALTLTNTTGAVTASNDLTVQGNLYVNGSTTQVNTTAITVEDRTIDLGIVNGSAPSSATTWDLGVLFNYHDGAAKKSAVIWENNDSRFKFASVLSADTDGTNVNTPQLTVTTFAPIEVAELWVNNSCTGGSSQVIACSAGELHLQNITVDAGTF